MQTDNRDTLCFMIFSRIVYKIWCSFEMFNSEASTVSVKSFKKSYQVINDDFIHKQKHYTPLPSSHQVVATEQKICSTAMLTIRRVSVL